MPIARSRVALVVAALSLGTFTYVTTETLPIGLLPLIASSLGTSQPAVGLLVSGYALVVVVTTIPLTRLTARVSRRALLTGLLVVLVLASVASALSTAYAALLAARLLTALSQALFWAIVVPTAATLVPVGARGRTVSFVYAGSSLATVLGIPAGTWLGQVVDWRAAFAGIAALGTVALVVVAALLPGGRSAAEDAPTGTAPDRTRYRVLVVVTALTVTGSFAALTYVTPFLTDVSGFAAGAIAGLLLVRGVAGFVAVVGIGRVVDRRPRAAMTLVVGAQAVALAAQPLVGAVPWAAAVCVVLSGAALGSYAAVLGARLLVVAPGSVDAASAGTSTAFNVGIMLGAFVGGAALPALGLIGVPAVGAALSVAALVLVLAEPRLALRRRPAAALPC